ncbi:MAG: twin transmembrane helix small protein [Alphaproteobacteria bacterium]|nr:twin transmembrane helix small protein [Alphaproteobacteria bacterium]
MNPPPPLLLGAALMAVLVVLAIGILGFAKGGPWYLRHANRLMNLRVATQALAVILLGLAIWFSRP